MPQARLGTTQHACVYVWKTYLLVVLVLLTPHPEGGEHFDLSSSQDMSAKTHENRTQDTHNDALSHAHAQNIDGTQEAGICATRMPRRQTICAVCCHAAPVLCFCLFSELSSINRVAVDQEQKRRRPLLTLIKIIVDLKTLHFFSIKYRY